MSKITIKLELNDKPNKDGQTTVRVRISKSQGERRHLRKVTDVTVQEKFWTGKHGAWISDKHPESKALNAKLATTLLKYTKAYNKLSDDDNQLQPTKEDVLNAVVKKEFHQDFMKYFKESKEAMTNWNNKKGFNTTYDKLIEWLDGKSISFNDINKDFLEDLELELVDQDLAPSSVHTQMKRVRRIFYMAVEEKVIDKNLSPFGKGGYQLPTPTETRELERLDKDEIRALFKQNYDKSTLKFWVHKAFCLSFLTAGTRIEDIMTLKWSNIRNGNIAYNMKKGVTGGTRKSFEIGEHLAPIIKSLEKTNQKQDDYIFPFLPKGIEDKDSETYKKEIGNKTSLYNSYLKEIADDIATDKNLTSHIARHTWAAITYEDTLDIKFIQENLGHKDIRTTIKYVGRLTTKKNDDKLKGVYNNLF